MILWSPRVRSAVSRPHLITFFLVAGWLLLPECGLTQERYVVTRIQTPIVLDGLSDEPAWQTIAPLLAVMHTPTFGAAPTERTEFRLAYDDEYVYVAGRMYDSEPSGVRGPALNRDHLSTGSDWLAVVLDTYSDKENALLFGTTPSGLRTDYAIKNDAEDPNNLSWDAFWDVAVTRNHEGWFAEMRIPFSSIRFQQQDDQVVMGFIAWRFIARKYEFDIFPAIPPNWGFFSVNKPSQAQEVVFGDVIDRKALYVTPYVLGGLGQSFDLNDANTAYDRADRVVREVGLDVKYGLTSNLNLDVTANTDFAQVEADDEQVNLTRFSLFFPEKRQFFQERSSTFDFMTGDFDRLFYSRRIGLSDGKSARIYGGARVVGRVGTWDVGFLNMQTAAIDSAPAENFGVLRVRRQLFNDNSYAGGMFTSRIGPGGSYNVAYGLDAIVRLFGNDYLTLNWAQTFDDEDPALAGPLDNGLGRLRWERRTDVGPGYDFGVTRVAERYNPEIGFVRRTDYTRLGDRLSFGWIAGPASPLLRHMLSLTGALFLRNADGSTESADLGVEWSLETKGGATAAVRAARFYDAPDAPFELADGVEVPAGKYGYHGVRASIGTRRSALLRVNTTLEGGTYYDGWRVTLGFRPTWQVSRHLELGSEYAYNRVGFPERDQRFDAHLWRLRVRAMFSTQVSLITFVQYNSAADAVIANFRFRYNPREGNNFYVVYNHGMNTDRHRLNPSLPLTDNRTILLKYSYTLIPTLR